MVPLHAVPYKWVSHAVDGIQNMRNGAREYVLTFMERVKETQPSESELEEAARLFRTLNERTKRAT